MNAVLNSFNFADAQSMDNAVLALNPDRPMAFVISAEAPGCGKTRFSLECFRRIFGHSVSMGRSEQPRSARQWQRTLFSAAEAGYLWIDDWRGPVKSPYLQAFLTQEIFEGRRYQTGRCISIRNNCVTFITGNDLKIDDALLRCVRVINLKKWPSEEASK